METKVRLDERDIRLMKRVAELGRVPRVDSEDWITYEELICIIEDLEETAKHWKEEFQDLKEDRDENWIQKKIENEYL